MSFHKNLLLISQVLAGLGKVVCSSPRIVVPGSDGSPYSPMHRSLPWVCRCHRRAGTALCALIHVRSTHLPVGRLSRMNRGRPASMLKPVTDTSGNWRKTGGLRSVAIAWISARTAESCGEFPESNKSNGLSKPGPDLINGTCQKSYLMRPKDFRVTSVLIVPTWYTSPVDNSLITTSAGEKSEVSIW